MLEENEGAVTEETNTDAVSQEASSEPENSSEKAPPEQAKEASQAKEPPFHEHPRFKELVDQKNTFASEAKELREKYAQMERQLRELTKPKEQPADRFAAVKERLKGIDPEFYEFVTSLAPAKSIEEVKAELEQSQAAQFRTSAVAEVTKLHTEHKVDAALQEKYNQELELAYSQGRIRNMSDVSTLYKAIHDGYTKLLEDVRRKDRTSYVSDKKADTKAPSSQPKGKPAVANEKVKWSTNREERNAQIVSEWMKEARAAKDI